MGCEARSLSYQSLSVSGIGGIGWDALVGRRVPSPAERERAREFFWCPFARPLWRLGPKPWGPLSKGFDGADEVGFDDATAKEPVC